MLLGNLEFCKQLQNNLLGSITSPTTICQLGLNKFSPSIKNIYFVYNCVELAACSIPVMVDRVVTSSWLGLTMSQLNI